MQLNKINVNKHDTANLPKHYNGYALEGELFFNNIIIINNAHHPMINIMRIILLYSPYRCNAAFQSNAHTF